MLRIKHIDIKDLLINERILNENGKVEIVIIRVDPFVFPRVKGFPNCSSIRYYIRNDPYFNLYDCTFETFKKFMGEFIAPERFQLNFNKKQLVEYGCACIKCKTYNEYVEKNDNFICYSCENGI